MRLGRVVFFFLVGLVVMASARPVQHFAKRYLRADCSTSEHVVAPFTERYGVSSTFLFSGRVDITVSGTGWSDGPLVGDAFYFSDKHVHDSQYYQLNVGVGTVLPFVGGLGNNIANFIVWVDGVGDVVPPYVPPYREDNTYHFIIDISQFGNTPVPLVFGVSDGIYEDNGGQYIVSLTQLCSPPPVCNCRITLPNCVADPSHVGQFLYHDNGADQSEEACFNAAQAAFAQCKNSQVDRDYASYKPTQRHCKYCPLEGITIVKRLPSPFDSSFDF